VPGELAVIAKPISIKLTGGTSGFRASKAVEFASGDVAGQGMVTEPQSIRPSREGKAGRIDK
jgi:hypothetical protein